ncbi:hypothetical protein K440DRAFT_663249 [Wilcoxina mikolae CBS 423.85]|nr:hypothetical protein K440DRAFT_663249 [Wilcoxina mikolae CBS 423.85]
MDIVGYGGAQLPETVGNALVNNGINLVSRFGSTECGFLMSSYRDFSTDKAWDYLRVSNDTTGISFECQSDGTQELVVLPDWPHMAKRNRPDGSFATSDLFTPHPTIPRAYKYATRSDSTIVLTNGKKFDPTPIEVELKKLDIVEEAIVFGQNKEYPGVLVFPSCKEISDIESSEQLNQALKTINAMLPSHGRIAHEMVVLIEYGKDWPKSSKGTPLRNAAEEVFANEIEHARQRYENIDSGVKMGTEDGERLQKLVARIVRQVVGRELDCEEDFFMVGVDSVMATAIRRMLLGTVDMKIPLPMNAVFEQRNIKNLAQYLAAGHEVDHESDHELADMREMVNQLKKISVEKEISRPQVVLLTGATGALGAHILHALLKAKVKKVICLCRAESASAATVRVLESLKRRKLPMMWDEATTTVQACPAEFSEAHLGVPKETFSKLATEGTMIIHAAWPVNFLASLPSFEAALAGTRNLLELGNTGTKKRFVFCSSTASVIRSPSPIREELSDNPEDASTLGYSRSKWVAEGIVHRAGGEVVRLGQLSGDTKEGIWNPEEGWPLLLKTLGQVGCLPELKERIQWLPVDVAGQVVANIALKGGNCRTGVWHVLNSRAVEWQRVLDTMENWCGRFERVPPEEWVRLLELEERKGVTVKLLGLWKDTYGTNLANKEVKEPVYEVGNTDGVYPGFARGIDIDEAYLNRIFAALGIERSGSRLLD